MYFDGFDIKAEDVFGADDKVTMAGYYQGVNKATGNSFKANATHVWKVKDDKLTHFSRQ